MPSREYHDFLETPWPQELYDDDWEKWRANERRYFASFASLCPSVRTEKCVIGGVKAEHSAPERLRRPDRMLYIHGGGFIGGSPEAVRDIVSWLCDRLGIECWSVDYRLAPQHSFPEPLEDCIQVYHSISAGSEAHIYVGGESAGGNLALALVQKLLQNKERTPDKVFVLSPSVSFEKPFRGMELQDIDLITGSLDRDEIANWYCPDADVRNPLLSPVNGQMQGHPPLFLSVGTDEVLFEDALRMYYVLRRAQGEVYLDVGSGMCHTYPTYVRYFPEARSACERIAAFLAGNGQTDGKNGAAPAQGPEKTVRI